MKHGVVRATCKDKDWCLIEFDEDDLQVKIFAKAQGDTKGSVPWELGSRVVICTEEEITNEG